MCSFYSKAHSRVLFRCDIHKPTCFSRKRPVWTKMSVQDGELKKLELIVEEVMSS